MEIPQRQAAVYEYQCFQLFEVYSKLLGEHQDESLWCCFQHSDYDRGAVHAPRRLQRRAFVCANSAAEELGLRDSESKALSVGALPQPDSLLRLLYAAVLSRGTPSPLIHRDRPGLVDSVISPAPFPRGACFVPASEDDDNAHQIGGWHGCKCGLWHPSFICPVGNLASGKADGSHVPIARRQVAVVQTASFEVWVSPSPVFSQPSLPPVSCSRSFQTQ